MPFSSRLKRKNEAVSAAHDRHNVVPDADLDALKKQHGELLRALKYAASDAFKAINAELDEIDKLINELRNG